MLTRSDAGVCAVLAIFLCVFGIVNESGSYNLALISILLSVGGALIVGLNWWAHGGGRSGSFLFLVLGYLFLCGRAVPVLFGQESSLGIVGFAEGFAVPDRVAAVYSLLVLTSFLFVHLGSLLPKNEVRSDLAVEPLAAKIYLVLFLLFLPAYLYKNYYYFSYIMSSGGYLAIYQGASHIEGIGNLVRIGALLCLSAFTLYFFYETNRSRARWMLVVFVVVFSSELLVGLRGKFFVISLTLFLFYKLRFGGSFSLKGMLIICLCVIGLAIIVELAREQKEESTVGASILLGFLAQQGVSAGVTQAILESPAVFSSHALDYFVYQFVAPLYGQADVPSGWFLANDLSLVLMPEAFELGFGTGSSYLAELVLLGGWTGVCLGSLTVGILLGVSNRVYNGLSGALCFWVVCGFVYYPRSMLHEPIHNLMRYAGPILLLSCCCWLIIRWVRGLREKNLVCI